MADHTTNIIEISLPSEGETQTYTLTPDTMARFTFDLSEATFTGVNGNLAITAEDGGTITLENYQSLAEAGTLPIFETSEGEQVPGDVYLFAFDGAAGNADEFETAADAAGDGSGAGNYSDDPGALFAGINALDGQGDAFASRSFEPQNPVTGFTPDAAASRAVFPGEEEPPGDGQPPVDKEPPLESAAPETGAVDLTTPEDTPILITEADILAFVTDPDNTPGELDVLSVSVDGTPLTATPGGWVYTPPSDWSGGPLDLDYTVTDGENIVDGTGTMTVTPVNDPPVAGNDRDFVLATPGNDGDGDGGNTNWSIIAQELNPGSGEWVESNLVEWGGHYGVQSSTDNRDQLGKDKNIENDGLEERLAITFEAPQSTVVLEVTAHGGGEEMIAILDSDGNYLFNTGDPATDPLEIDFSGNRITVSYPGGSIGTVYLLAPDSVRGGGSTPDVALKDVSSIPAEQSDSGDEGEATVAEGNVLYNDYDIDSNPLEVFEARAEGEGWTEVDAESGDLLGTLIPGQHGNLYLYENGDYTYVLNPDALEGDTIPEPETFEYRVVDNDGGEDTATLTINIFDTSAPGFTQGTDGRDNLNIQDGEDNVIFGMEGDDILRGHGGDDMLIGGSGDDRLWGGTGDDTLYGGEGDDVLGGHQGSDTLWGGAGDDTIYGGQDESRVYVSEGNDTIFVTNSEGTVVIDPAYIGEEGSNTTVRGFESGNDILEFGDVTGKTINVDDLGADLRITLANPGGGTTEEDIVITLDGVIADDFQGNINISDNAELNQLIQDMITANQADMI